MERACLCIDLKSFFASVECVERGLDPFKVNLVVADPSRGQGAITLAISPKMKTLGVKNRCRIFEIPKNIQYITAVPRMRYYMEYAARIYKIFLKYIAKEDIHVYSIDESFLEVGSYLKLYNMTLKELARTIMNDIYQTTGITATAGMGPNLYLAKVALDILSKKSKDGMGYLDEDLYKQWMWPHRPITDFWQVGNGTARRLEKYGIYDMGGVARCLPDVLQKEFGVNGLYLYDHAWGKEPTLVSEIKQYKPKAHSVSNSQILFEDYNSEDALLVLKEMVDTNVYRLIANHLVTDRIGLYIGYSKNVSKPTSVMTKITNRTNSCHILMDEFVRLYKRSVKHHLPIRQIAISFQNVKDEIYESYDLFTDIEKIEEEKKIQNTLLQIKEKYGKNAVLKGMNVQEKATAIKRNKLIGGHNAQ